MEQLIFGSKKDAHFTFDFRGKRVKLQYDAGKPMVESKFSLCYFIKRISYYKGSYAEDIFKYAECAQMLLELLEDRKFYNVTIIK